MTMSVATDAKREELLQVARLCGENLSRRAFGERGPGLNVTMAGMEQLLKPMVEAMAAGFLAASAEDQTERLPDSLPYPDCGRECSRSEHKRTLSGEHGPFTWSEPRCDCEHCERSFFPSADGTED